MDRVAARRATGSEEAVQRVHDEQTARQDHSAARDGIVGDIGRSGESKDEAEQDFDGNRHGCPPKTKGSGILSGKRYNKDAKWKA